MNISDIKNIYLPIFNSYGVTNVWLFGSRARGTNRPDSDVDFLYEESSKLTNDPLLALSLFEELEQATTMDIDLVRTKDLKFIGGNLKETIDNEKVALFSNS